MLIIVLNAWKKKKKETVCAFIEGVILLMCVPL